MSCRRISKTELFVLNAIPSTQMLEKASTANQKSLVVFVVKNLRLQRGVAHETITPRQISSSAVTLDPELFNYIAENLKRLDKWTVRPPLNLQQTPAGNLLSLSPTPPGKWFWSSSPASKPGAGKYSGAILAGKSTGAVTNTFQLDPPPRCQTVDGPAATPTAWACRQQRPDLQSARAVRQGQPHALQRNTACIRSTPSGGSWARPAKPRRARWYISMSGRCTR